MTCTTIPQEYTPKQTTHPSGLFIDILQKSYSVALEKKEKDVLDTIDTYEIALHVQEAVLEAGAYARARRRFRSSVKTETKPDDSVVTAVDHHNDDILRKTAAKYGIGYLSEESVGDVNHDLILYTDPLDGTRPFIEGSEDFTIVATLMERVDGATYTPFASFIYQPMTNVMWQTIHDEAWATIGEGAKPGNYMLAKHTPQSDQIAVIMPKRTRFKNVRALVRNTIKTEPDMQLINRGSTGLIGGLLAQQEISAAVFGHEDAHEIAAMTQIIGSVSTGFRDHAPVICDFDGRPLEAFELERTDKGARFVVPNGTIFANTPQLALRLLAITKDALYQAS